MHWRRNFFGSSARHRRGQVFVADARIVHDTTRRVVTLRVNPRGVKPVVAVGDLQETGGLYECRFPNAGHFLQLLPIPKRTMLAPIIIQAARRELIQPGHVTQQRGTRRIDVHANIVNARFDDRIERSAKMFGLHVVLIKTHPNIGRVDLDQFRERIKDAATDRYGATNTRVQSGQLFTPDGACRIDAGSRFVHDDERHILILKLVAQSRRHEQFRLATPRAIADCNQPRRMLSHQPDQLSTPGVTSRPLAHHVNDIASQDVSEFIQHAYLATASQARVNGQDTPIAHGRLQQQLLQVANENLDRMLLGAIGHLAPQFTFERRYHQPVQAIADTTAKKIGVRMVDRHHQFLGRMQHGRHVGCDPHT